MLPEFIINLPEHYSFNYLNLFMENETTIEQLSYKNAEQSRILKACLETWFKNPKDLQLTSPKVSYPFKFKNWIDTSYLKLESVTYVLKKDDWIIGHMSIQLRPQFNSIHIFHLFVDRANRSKGFSKLLVNKALEYSKRKQIQKITLAVNRNNPIAIKLYQTYGFEIVGENKIGSYKMLLEINKSKNQ